MKKLSLILLSVLAAAQSTQANPASFSGFYIGGQLGWTQRDNKTEIQDNIPPEVREVFSKTKKTNGLTYGLYTGYGQDSNGFYFGGEFSLESDTASKNITYIVTQGANETIGKVKYDRGVVVGIAARLGAIIAHKNLIYVKLGIEYSRDKVKGENEFKRNGVTVDTETNPTRSKTNFAFVPSIGYERAFGNVLARVEYGYNCGGNIKVEGGTIKYTAHIVKFGCAWKF